MHSIQKKQTTDNLFFKCQNRLDYGLIFKHLSLHVNAHKREAAHLQAQHIYTRLVRTGVMM